MQIRFTQAVAGARYSYRKGKVYEMPAVVAEKWLARRLAVPADPAGGVDSGVETATMDAGERATLPVGRRRRGGGRRASQRGVSG